MTKRKTTAAVKKAGRIVVRWKFDEAMIVEPQRDAEGNVTGYATRSEKHAPEYERMPLVEVTDMIVQPLKDPEEKADWWRNMVAVEKYFERRKLGADGSRKGGETTAKNKARPALDELLQGFLNRGERPPVELLAMEYGVHRSNIYRRIARLKNGNA